MSEKSVAQKARVKPGTKVSVLHGEAGVVAALGLPEPVFTEPGEAQLLFLFVRDAAELAERMPPAVSALATGAALWVFFRKGGSAAGLDMTRDDVWALAERLDLRPLGIVGVDQTWSAFRLRRA